MSEDRYLRVLSEVCWGEVQGMLYFALEYGLGEEELRSHLRRWYRRCRRAGVPPCVLEGVLREVGYSDVVEED